MSTLTVLDVGNCDHDHRMIRSVLTPFKVRVLRAAGEREALEALRSEPVTLVLVNRQLDIDSSKGVDLILKLKADPAATSARFMLISNFDWAQAEAVAVGAVPGFGKDDIATGRAADVLTPLLTRSPVSPPVA